MTQELVQREIVVHPITGEQFELDKIATEDIGAFIYDLREWVRIAQEAINAASREALRRQDKDAKWTTPAGKFVLKGASPAAGVKEEFDAAALYEELRPLVAEGFLTKEALDAAIEKETVYKTKRAGLNALRKLGGDVVDVINRNRVVTEKPRYVRVDRVRA